jgi:fibronectin type 3 domain-containing protein
MHASSFVGGTYDEVGNDVEVDAEGNIYVVSHTMSGDFPITPGAYNKSNGYLDVGVTKLNHNCSKIIWCAIIGGDKGEWAEIELDSQGYIYLAGDTWSYDFPITQGAFQGEINWGANNYGRDFFVTKLKPDGSGLIYSTFVGGTGPESRGGFAVHDGKAYVSGWTDSKDFPARHGQYAAHHGDAVLFVLEKDGSRLNYTRFWGGDSSERADTVYVNDDGIIATGGYTSSMGFRVTPGAYCTTRPSFQSGWVSVFDPEPGGIDWCTFIGRCGEIVTAITMDEEGYVYFGGSSWNTYSYLSYPLTEGAFDTEYNGRNEGFITKMDPQGTRLIYSTLLGGDDKDDIQDMEVDDDGRLTVVGTMELGGNYTVTEGCLDNVTEGSEGFLITFDEDGAPAYSTFLGGMFADSVQAVEITPWDNLVVTGSTGSREFPVGEDACQPVIGGGADIYVSVIGDLSPPSAPRNLMAEGSEGKVTLHWQEPLDDGNYSIRKYLVHRGPSADDLRVYHVLDDIWSFVDEDVEYGVDYYYAVQATNFKGYSPLSNVVVGRPMAAPDAPVNLTGTVLVDSIELEWEAPDFTGGIPLTEFRLYRGLTEDAMELIATVPHPTFTFSDTDLVDQTTYVYHLTCANDYKESRGLASITLRAAGVTTPPRELDHTYGELFIRVTWEVPEDVFGFAVDRYNVYRTDGDGEPGLVGTTSARWFLDDVVEVGTAYTYTVTAVNAKGESDPSEALEATARVRPASPMDTGATAERLLVQVTWSPPGFDGASPVLEYRVYHEDDGWQLLGSVGAGGALVFLHGVPYDGTARSYRVTAVNAEGESDPGPVVTTRAYQVPDPPEDLMIERGDGQLTLEWKVPTSDGGTPILSFNLFRRSSSEEDYTLLLTLPAGTIRHVDDTTTNGVEYFYRATASNFVGESTPSPQASAVPAGLPLPPLEVSAEGLNGSAKVTWRPPEDAGGLPVEGYRVYLVAEGMELVLKAEVGPDIGELVVTDLENGMVHIFAVMARTGAGDSPLSDVAEATPVGAPDEPQGLVALWMDGYVYVAWSAPSFDGGSLVTGYHLRRDDGNWTTHSNLTMSFEDDDVEWGETYNYTLYAVNAAGESSRVKVAFTVPQEPEEPPEASEVSAWPYVVVALVLVVVAVVLLTLMWKRKGGDTMVVMA